jgi:hypothetical protein
MDVDFARRDLACCITVAFCSRAAGCCATQHAGDCWIGRDLQGSGRSLTEVLTRHLSGGKSLKASIGIADVPPETRTERLPSTNQEPCPYGILLGHNSFRILTHFIPVYGLCQLIREPRTMVWSSSTPEYYVALLLNIMWPYSWILHGLAPEHHVGILLNITWPCSWTSCGHVDSTPASLHLVDVGSASDVS